MAENINIVTGHTGVNHVTSNDVRHFNAGLFGDANYVLNIGDEWAAVRSGSTVQVSGGDAVMQGTHVRSDEVISLPITITSTRKAIDLIGILYSKDGAGVESATLTVIEGESTSGTPVEPTYPAQDILGGGILAFMPLWAVRVQSGGISSITQKFRVMSALNAPQLTYSNWALTVTAGRQASVSLEPIKDYIDGLTNLHSENSFTPDTTNVATSVCRAYWVGRIGFINLQFTIKAAAATTSSFTLGTLGFSPLVDGTIPPFGFGNRINGGNNPFAATIAGRTVTIAPLGAALSASYTYRVTIPVVLQ